jgi:hypothetical protein
MSLSLDITLGVRRSFLFRHIFPVVFSIFTLRLACISPKPYSEVRRLGSCLSHVFVDLFFIVRELWCLHYSFPRNKLYVW